MGGGGNHLRVALEGALAPEEWSVSVLSVCVWFLRSYSSVGLCLGIVYLSTAGLHERASAKKRKKSTSGLHNKVYGRFSSAVIDSFLQGE